MRMFDSLARWDESAEIGKREQIGAFHGSAFNAERDANGDLLIHHHSREGIPTSTVGDRKRCDARAMGQKIHVATLYGRNFDAERDESGELQIYRNPPTGLPAPHGLLGDDAVDESDRDFLAVYRQLRALEAATLEKHQKFIAALRSNDPVYGDKQRLEAEARAASLKYVAELSNAFAEARARGVEIYHPGQVAGIPAKAIGDASVGRKRTVPAKTIRDGSSDLRAPRTKMDVAKLQAINEARREQSKRVAEDHR
jgi:hypothetical protein